MAEHFNVSKSRVSKTKQSFRKRATAKIGRANTKQKSVRAQAARGSMRLGSVSSSERLKGQRSGIKQHLRFEGKAAMGRLGLEVSKLESSTSKLAGGRNATENIKSRSAVMKPVKVKASAKMNINSAKQRTKSKGLKAKAARSMKGLIRGLKSSRSPAGFSLGIGLEALTRKRKPIKGAKERRKALKNRVI